MTGEGRAGRRAARSPAASARHVRRRHRRRADAAAVRRKERAHRVGYHRSRFTGPRAARSGRQDADGDGAEQRQHSVADVLWPRRQGHEDAAVARHQRCNLPDARSARAGATRPRARAPRSRPLHPAPLRATAPTRAAPSRPPPAPAAARRLPLPAARAAAAPCAARCARHGRRVCSRCQRTSAASVSSAMPSARRG